MSMRSFSSGATKPAQPLPEKPVPPPPGTYVILLPKDQILRHPPPSATPRHHYKPRRRLLCCCTIALLFLLSIPIAALLYLTFRPQAPKISVVSIAVRGLNLTSPAPIWPEIDVTLRVRNSNSKIGIYYERRESSSVKVYYSDFIICNGVIPAFHQPSNNVTVLHMALRGPGIILDDGVNLGLVNEEREGKVPLRLVFKPAVKFELRALKRWTVTVNVNCDVTVDSSTVESKIVNSYCNGSIKLW